MECRNFFFFEISLPMYLQMYSPIVTNTINPNHQLNADIKNTIATRISTIVGAIENRM